MATFNPVGASAPSAVTVSSKSTPNIRSITLGLIDAESTLTFSSAIVAYKIKSRDGSKLKIATSSGDTLTDDKWEIMPGSCFEDESLTTSTSKTFYVSSNKATTVVQIIEWT